ncbi:hypothetical protein H4R21_001245, partial [Coemansia helicoidea]
LEAALFRVSAGVLDEWRAYVGAQQPAPRATLESLVAFLTTTYESACNAYMASTALAALRFDAREDIAVFNKDFSRLLGLAELEEGGSFALNLYRQAMPETIRRELFGEAITSLRLAKEAAMRRWDVLRSLTPAGREGGPATDGSEPMDIDRMQQRSATGRGRGPRRGTSQRGGLQRGDPQRDGSWRSGSQRDTQQQRPWSLPDPSMFPCSKQEFDRRLAAGRCLWCGKLGHTYHECRLRQGSIREIVMQTQQADANPTVNDNQAFSGNV